MNEMYTPLVSVYTCVYNMADKIHRVFDSMKALNYKNIEHIIVNDGSTDNVDQLIEKYISEVTFPVKYFKKENGGKHTALNMAWDNALGEFMIQCDADDELTPQSVTFLVETYYSIPEKKRSEYWCVQGACRTQYGEFVGDKYPENINELPWREAAKLASMCKGERIGLQKRELLLPYRFPEVVGAAHIPEGIIWGRINNEYGTYYTNEVVRVYYVNEGNNLTSKKKTRKQYASAAYWYKYQLMNPEVYSVNILTLVKYALLYCISWNKYKENNSYLVGSLWQKIMLTVLYPIAFIGAYAIRYIKHIR